MARQLLGDAAFQYSVFVAIAFALMAASALAVIWLCRRALARREGDVELRAAILVFVASPALVLLVHLVGYLDYLGLLFSAVFALVAAAAKARWPAYVLAGIGGPLLALVHEAQTILFMPVALFALACREAGAARRPAAAEHERRAAGLRAALSLAAVLALALGTSAYVTLAGDPQRVGALNHWLRQRVDFTLHYGVFNALQAGSPVGLFDTMYEFWSVPARAIWWFKALVLFLPAHVFLIVCGWRAIGVAEGASRRVVALLRALFLVACASPLALNVVAWDYARWFALAASNALVCLLAFHASWPSRPRREAGALALPLGAALTIALGLASDAIFFNRAEVSYYPFFEHWQAVAEQLGSGTLESPKD